MTQGPPQPPIEEHTWTYLYAMPCALRINSNTDNGYERILYWRRIEYFFQGVETEKKPDFPLPVPHSYWKVSEGFCGHLNSESSSLHSKVGGLRLHQGAAGFLKTVLWKGKSCKTAAKEVARALESWKRSLGFTVVVWSGEWVRKGLCSLLRNCQGCTRDLGRVESKTFRLNGKLQP